MKENVLDTLRNRGYIEQITFEEDLRKLLENESVPFYIGFDPCRTLCIYDGCVTYAKSRT